MVDDTRSEVSPTASSLARTIWDQALADHLEPGDRIGAERELSARYGVGRWLVRKALEQLEADGLVLRTTGRSGGVFVAHKKLVRDLSDVVGLPTYLHAQGITAGAMVLGTSMAPAGEMAPFLGIRSDEWTICVRRLRLAESLPLSVESIWLPAERFPGLLDHSLVGSLLELLETEYGLQPGEAVETVGARPAEHDEAINLQIATGRPVLAVTRTSRSVTGEIYEYGKEIYRADRVEIVVPIRAGKFAARRVVE